jgi:Fe2+ transport system protein B
MMLSAVFLAILGLLTSYMPDKVLGAHGTVPDSATLMLVQMMGALYLGFAILNWTARGVLIGGIYARPVALGNFLHFAMVGVMLIREAIEHSIIQLATSAFVFSAFAIGFGLVLFRAPVRAPEIDD